MAFNPRILTIVYFCVGLTIHTQLYFQLLALFQILMKAFIRIFYTEDFTISSKFEQYVSFKNLESLKNFLCLLRKQMCIFTHCLFTANFCYNVILIVEDKTFMAYLRHYKITMDGIECSTE